MDQSTSLSKYTARPIYRCTVVSEKGFLVLTFSRLLSIIDRCKVNSSLKMIRLVFDYTACSWYNRRESFEDQLRGL